MIKRIEVFFLFVFSLFCGSFFLVYLLSFKINPILYNYVNLEVERITSNVIDGSINDILAKDIDDNLFSITKNSNGEIQTIDYDTQKVNELLKVISNDIQNKLLAFEDGSLDDVMISDSFKGKNFKYIKKGVVCEIPTGSLSGNSFLSNLGPVIPIKMSFLGQVNSNLHTKITNYGINNLYLEIDIHVEVKERITMPVMSKDSIIKVDAPLSIKVIQGVVPKYYGGIISQDSNLFSLPNS